jgi:hypothetical protein
LADPEFEFVVPKREAAPKPYTKPTLWRTFEFGCLYVKWKLSSLFYPSKDNLKVRVSRRK